MDMYPGLGVYFATWNDTAPHTCAHDTVPHTCAHVLFEHRGAVQHVELLCSILQTEHTEHTWPAAQHAYRVCAVGFKPSHAAAAQQ